MDSWSPRVFTWGGFSSSLPTPPQPPLLPTPPPRNTGLKLMHTFEKSSERPKIKQGTTSKVNCILFNRLLNPVLLNKSGLVQAKASNFNLKSLNKCFSNYYQVQTWPVFAETRSHILRIYGQAYFWMEKLQAVHMGMNTNSSLPW